MRLAAVRRPSFPLTDEDQSALTLLRAAESQRGALERLTGEPGITADVSEAALLHAVFKAGLAAVRAATEEEGYAELAAQQVQNDDVPQRRAAARRRRPAWSTEA